MTRPTTKDVQDQLVRHRRLQQRLRGASNKTNAPRRYEIFSVAGPGNSYSCCTTMKLAVKIAEAEARENPDTVVSVWSPLRGHVYQAVVEDGRYTVLHGDVETSRHDGAEHQPGSDEK